MTVHTKNHRALEDPVDHVVTDPSWVARRDQAMAALHRSRLPIYGGSVRDEIAADEQGTPR